MYIEKELENPLAKNIFKAEPMEVPPPQFNPYVNNCGSISGTLLVL